MKYISSIFLFLAFSIAMNAQDSHAMRFGRKAVVDPSTMTQEWNPVLQTIEVHSPDADADKIRYRHVKDSMMTRYPKYRAANAGSRNAPVQAASVTAPFLNRNFAGNIYNSSTPCDNDIAISNGGKIVSVQNSTVFRYDIVTDTTTSPTASLNNFFAALGNVQSKFDPRVIYDPIDDRFVLVCLAGFTHSTSSILVAFSQTNDPSGAWNVYEIPGNPLNDTLWTDYPMVALTQHDFLLTVNLLYDNQPWQTGWNQSVIWQIRKQDGYNGDTLTSQLHTNIQHNGRRIRNLCPVKGGSTLYGPDCYFVSDRNLDAVNDTFFLVHVTDTLNAPGQQVIASAMVSNQVYAAPPNADQPTSSDDMATNDARVLAAFFENNKIQFVGNTMDTTTGLAAAYHGVIDNPSTTPTVSGALITDPLIEYGYPNIVYLGNSPSDNSALISMLYTSATLFPGYEARVFDGTSSYSPSTVARTGLGYVNVLNGTERWGDYSGSQRRYNNPGEIWTNGYYGLANHKHATWIAEYGLTSTVGIAPQPKPVVTNVFPNPFADQIEVEFSLEQSDILRFDLYDAQGRLVKVLLQDRVKGGISRFSFSVSVLPKGNYILRISSSKGELASKVITRQ